MPIYEYKCSKCGKELELMHKVSDPAPAECPECHAAGSLERLMSRSAFHLKGGGWYSDLYGSSNKGGAASGGSSSASGSTTSTPSTTGSVSTAPSSGTSTSTSTPASSGSSSSGSNS